MTDHVYKIIEIAGTSSASIEDAIKNALAKASKTVRNMCWLQVVETRGHIENQQLTSWQIMVKVGFALEENGLIGDNDEDIIIENKGKHRKVNYSALKNRVAVNKDIEVATKRELVYTFRILNLSPKPTATENRGALLKRLKGLGIREVVDLKEMSKKYSFKS